ncbi:MAG TPA: SRPBCC family protein [Candidatus Acidoferrum sp.]|nr:SRPBCC family protein [Candidatus Acidoferrum sp.]
MQLENSFQVGAPPDKVFDYLLDVNKVVGCVPGAELTEVVDQTTFKGKVKIKVGPITVAYSGTARIAERDDAQRSATLSADGRETTGSGSARATATMKVQPAGKGSLVEIVTEYHVAGRVAQFGRGVMEDVSKRLIKDMANCIQSNLEAAEPNAVEDEQLGGPGAAHASNAVAAPQRKTVAREINVFQLLASVLWARLFGSRQAHEALASEPLDPGTVGIGVLLGLASVVGIALAVAVTLAGLEAIFKSA